ncbi:hypothetical protein [Arthrobacter sp. Bi26]|uniref:hypothetical protein n=1 Tax=Arthrobacter sp. Bi26 TaxID=2822350 RepID=UPI001E5D3C00|nr:hypothetical protein [Arthrobacter sp. Bi26]
MPERSRDMLRAPGDRVKTDRRDARVLAEMLAVGSVIEVRIPDPEEEALRDPDRVCPGPVPAGRGDQLRRCGVLEAHIKQALQDRPGDNGRPGRAGPDHTSYRLAVRGEEVRDAGAAVESWLRRTRLRER